MSTPLGVSVPGLIDLHTHSTASDGTLSPVALVKLAAQRGISVIAVTDHDTTAGIDEATRAAATLGVTVIPAIEFSTDVPTGEVHLLGYGIDPLNAGLQEATAAFRATREERARRMLDLLRAIGIDVPADLLPTPGPGMSIGRPHVARALISMGVVDSVDEAFARYLMAGRPAYVPRFRLAPERAVHLVLEAGGLPVLAHPRSAEDLDDLLPRLLAVGLRGLEAFYGEYSNSERDALATMAAAHGLLATGGSDYHGPDGREGRDLASVALPEDAWNAMRAALRQTAWGRFAASVSDGPLC